MSWIRRFDTRKLVTLIAFLAIFAMAARVSMDTDTWWHLRAGQWIVEHCSILTADHFSYTRFGTAWQYPGWLVEVPMIWIFNWFGPGGMNLWTAAMVTLAFIFIWKTMQGGPFMRAFVIVLAAAASGVYWAARPYLVTFVLSAVFLWLLEDYRTQGYPSKYRRLYWLPALMVLWANSHGGFAVGFIILGVYLLGTVGICITNRRPKIVFSQPAFKSLAILLLLNFIAVCINPYGPVMLLYPFKTIGIGALQDYIQEWQSPNFHAIEVQPFVWLLLLTFSALGISRRRIQWEDLALSVGFAYMGLLAGRNVALFALAAPMVMTRHLAPITEALSRRIGFRPLATGTVPRAKGLLNVAIAVILFFAVVLKVMLVLPESVNESAFARGLPLKAVAYIQESQPVGRMLSSYNWGGYLLWALPEYPVFVDGRTDLYNDEIINEWLQAVRAEPGWEDVLDRWDVRLVLLEPGTPLLSELKVEGWQMLFQDEKAVLYGR